MNFVVNFKMKGNILFQNNMEIKILAAVINSLQGVHNPNQISKEIIFQINFQLMIPYKTKRINIP